VSRWSGIRLGERFNLSVPGDVAFTVDGEPVDFTQLVTSRGIMIIGLPNMAYVFGHFRHSWTLPVDLVSGLLHRSRVRVPGRLQMVSPDTP